MHRKAQFAFEPGRKNALSRKLKLSEAESSLIERKPSGIEAGLPSQLDQRLHDSCFMKACRKESTDYTPVWLMRQAGRYMKEFRDIRSRVGFLELCKNPELACQVTVHAQETIGADAAIIFADILLIADALGLGLEFVKGEGPLIHKPLRAESDIAALPDINPSDSLSYVLEAIKLTRRALKAEIPLLGFAAAPFTLASYLIEGGSSRNYEITKTMIYSRPDLWQKLMDKLVDISAAYLSAQVAAGAQALQVFDSWVGCLSARDYRNFVLPFSKRLIESLPQQVPVIHFGVNTAAILPVLKEAGSDLIGLDWRVDLAKTWAELGDIAVQGNLDPCVLFADKEIIKAELKVLLDSVRGKKGHIFNLGHGVLPGTDVEKVKYLVEQVHELSRQK